MGDAPKEGDKLIFKRGALADDEYCDWAASGAEVVFMRKDNSMPRPYEVTFTEVGNTCWVCPADLGLLDPAFEEKRAAQAEEALRELALSELEDRFPKGKYVKMNGEDVGGWVKNVTEDGKVTIQADGKTHVRNTGSLQDADESMHYYLHKPTKEETATWEAEVEGKAGKRPTPPWLRMLPQGYKYWPTAKEEKAYEDQCYEGYESASIQQRVNPCAGDYEQPAPPWRSNGGGKV